MRLLRWRRRRPEIICQQWVELVTDYIEGALPLELRQAADRHLAACPHCREYLEQTGGDSGDPGARRCLRPA